METLLGITIVGIVVAVIISALGLTVQPQIIYVQTADQRNDALGCLIFIVAGILILLVLGAMGS